MRIHFTTTTKSNKTYNIIYNKMRKQRICGFFVINSFLTEYNNNNNNNNNNNKIKVAVD